MEFNLIQSIVYALFSGFSEFLPISSDATQSILRNLFASGSNTVVLDFLIHLAALVAVYINCQNYIGAIARTRKLLQIPRRRRKREPDTRFSADYRLVRSALVPALILVLLRGVSATTLSQLYWVAAFLLVSGVVLYATGRIPIGNKTAGHMNRLDGFFFGVCSGLGIFPGISRLGLGVSYGVIRGASPQNALNWAFLVSVPVLIGLCISDIVLMFTLGIGSFGFLILLQCLLSAVFAYLGATLSIALVRFIANRSSLSWFSYICWGMAFFSFLLYMI